MSTAQYDVLVIGGGPGGLAAAVEAAGAGLSVAVVDERVTLGGQIFKQPGPGFRVTNAEMLGKDFARGRALIEAAERSGAELLTRTSALAIEGTEVMLVEEGGNARSAVGRRIVLAPGAHDRPVVFPGWTLPGVITAGGAQTLVKTQRILPGRRIVFAGSGPVALAFPAQLRGYGANVTTVLEAGPGPGLRDLLSLLGAARGNVHLLREGAGYRSRLLRDRVPIRNRRIVVRAEGEGRVEQVVHAAVDSDWRPLPGSEETEPADTLCVGYGFIPSTELPRLAGCAFAYDENLGGPVVVRDAWLRTTVDGISAVGDGAGVHGSYVAIDEGRLAALGAALELDAVDATTAAGRAAAIRARIERKEAFRQALQRLYAVGPGVYELASADTIVCRCEGVTAGALDDVIAMTSDVNTVKGLTRVSMGMCQGRNCQRHLAAAIARAHGGVVAEIAAATPRAPLRPVAISAVADATIGDEGFFTRDS